MGEDEVRHTKDKTMTRWERDPPYSRRGEVRHERIGRVPFQRNAVYTGYGLERGVQWFCVVRGVGWAAFLVPHAVPSTDELL